MSTMLSQTYIKQTRKPHICFGCGRKFAVGISMTRETWKDGRSAFTSYLCETCVDIIAEFEFDDEYGFGDLYNEAIEREVEGT